VSAAGQARGLQAALEHNSLRLIDVAAGVDGPAGQDLRRVGTIGVELAALLGGLLDQWEGTER
jgi:hypothetical protein